MVCLKAMELMISVKPGSYLVYEDVEQAKELIKEAGYDENHPLPPITILYNTSEMHKAIAEAIQATWHKAFGADVRLQNQETKVFPCLIARLANIKWLVHPGLLTMGTHKTS